MESRRSDLIAVRSSKRQNEARLLRRQNVVGVGVGYKTTGGASTGELAVIVSVRQKQPAARLGASERVPRALDGIKTDVVETGELVALTAPVDPTQKMRPARPGVSIGHYQITAGTLGCLVTRGNDVFILSNNHVLANSNDGKLGDAILQPGSIDGGTTADQIGVLADFIPIAFEGSAPPAPPPGCSPLALLLSLLRGTSPTARQNEPGNNKVDCALARPTAPGWVSPDILNIGVPVGQATATLGTQVQKFGRTTGYTRSTIQQIDLTATINYGGRVAVYTGQLMAGAMSQGGDSGSAVLDMNCRVVGLLFAGSTTTTVLNPIQLVLSALNAEILTTP